MQNLEVGNETINKKKRKTKEEIKEELKESTVNSDKLRKNLRMLQQLFACF